MKLVITACALVAITLLPSIVADSSRARADEPAGKRAALLVGVNKYDKRLFNDLSYAERDVEEMASVLEKVAIIAWPAVPNAAPDRRCIPPGWA